MTPDSSHFIDSSLREKVIEHLFVGDLLRCLWRQGVHNVEVLRAEVDRGGYDLVFECGHIIRHVQLKSSYSGAQTREVDVSLNLAGKPSGCVIWLWCNPENMQLGPFLWFGGAPEEPLPALGDKIGTNSRGRKTARPNIRVVKKSKFQKLGTIEEIATKLFSGFITFVG